VEQPDLRPAVVLDHVVDAAINGLGAQGNPQARSLLRFIESTDILVTAARVLSPAEVFLLVEGSASKSIVVDGGALSKATRSVSFAAGASENAVKLRS